jgi:hypothetical protein
LAGCGIQADAIEASFYGDEGRKVRDCVSGRKFLYDELRFPVLGGLKMAALTGKMATDGDMEEQSNFPPTQRESRVCGESCEGGQFRAGEAST